MNQTNSAAYVLTQGPPRSAYIHVPFCHQRCPYCNFTLVAGREDWIDRYIVAIERELSSLETPQEVSTIFIGGGTPSLLDESQLDRLADAITHWLPIDAGGEWTIEANPRDLTPSKTQAMAEVGINRVSIGGQSFDANKLRILGRDHSGEDLRKAIEITRSVFENVSLDLIFGVPGETIDTWLLDIDLALQSGVNHLSSYGLTYEKGAAFWSQHERGTIVATSEDAELDMYFAGIDRMVENGWEHYEVSNFSKPGNACRHNVAYWNARPWLAFGPGAASFVGGIRSTNHRSTSKYLERIEKGISPIAESEKIDWGQWTCERFVFGMRQLNGVDMALLQLEGERETLRKIKPTIDGHIQDGWFIREGSKIRLSRAGLAISDSLWPDYF